MNKPYDKARAAVPMNAVIDALPTPGRAMIGVQPPIANRQGYDGDNSNNEEDQSVHF